jgi:DNA-3-methyladenine glycosylase I
LTILRKREGYRRAFERFDVKKVAAFDETKFNELMVDGSIVRNRLKIAAAINNARAFMAVQKEFGSFDAYCWAFVGGGPKINRFKSLADIPTTTREAQAFSADLKKRGFKFVGPTVIYAHMQAIGMVNDHLVDCFRHQQILKQKK